MLDLYSFLLWYITWIECTLFLEKQTKLTISGTDISFTCMYITHIHIVKQVIYTFWSISFQWLGAEGGGASQQCYQ